MYVFMLKNEKGFTVSCHKDSKFSAIDIARLFISEVGSGRCGGCQTYANGGGWLDNDLATTVFEGFRNKFMCEIKSV